MNIYIVPAWYPENEKDLNGIFVREQAHALAGRGHNVTVVHIEYVSVTRVFKQPWRSKRVWQDGNVRTIFYKAIVPIVGKLSDLQDKYISNMYTKILKNLIDEDKANGMEPPDLIHAHVSHSCAYYCIKASKFLQIPLVVTEHYSGLILGTASDKDYARVKKTIENSDAFIFVGSNFQKYVCDKLNISVPTYFVPNMIETSDYYIKKNENSVFTFLTACSLKKLKSVDLVIKAFNKAFHKNNYVKLNIAGDGDERNNLQKLVGELGETNKIKFFGRYSREESNKIFSSADAFVLTSEVETFGIVYIEALASGVPCIGTKGQGADDIINESNGFRVEYGNIQQLADAMKSLYENRDKYNSNSIRNDCISRFDKESVCRRIEEVYRRVL